jgi:hypothetical protein
MKQKGELEMKKIVITSLIVVVLVGLGVVFANGIGNSIPDNGKHYQINIIGVPKGKTADMSNPNRRTIFVNLGNNGAITTKINIVPNTADPCDFDVLDGNGTDGEATIAVPYDTLGDLSYNVYAIALGKPGGSVHVDAEVTFTNGDIALLETSFDLKRNTGQPTVKNISNIFRASGWIDTNGSGVEDSGDTTFTNVWVFNLPNLEDYYWNYDNSGLQHMQVRFYQTTSGSYSTVP